jgi:GNAT superfamily N-acetyltransferase
MPDGEASIQRLAAANHVSWHGLPARLMGGSVSRRDGFILAVDGGPEAGAEIFFPRLSPETGRDQLDQVIAECRRSGRVRSIGCWSLLPTVPGDLAAWMMGRNFGWGWQPHWMGLELSDIAELVVPDGYRLAGLDNAVDWPGADIPYYSKRTGRMIGRLAAASPRTSWYVAVFHGDQPVGLGAVHVTDNDPSSAGLYDFGVAHDHRRRGIGTALAVALSRVAADQGCRRVTLNSTSQGESTYRRAGFLSGGFGQTWWMHAPALEAGPPPPIDAAFIEAVVGDDIGRLDAVAPRLDPADLDRRFANGMTPVEMGVSAKSPGAVSWLERSGATVDVFSAWGFGGRSKVLEVLSHRPGLVNRPVDDNGQTPLHVAVLRRDPGLATVLLDAGADPSLTDDDHQSTPFGWAQWFGYPEMAHLIETHPGADRSG